MFGIPIHRVQEIEKKASELWLKYSGGNLPVTTHKIFNDHGIQVRPIETDSEVEAEFDLSKAHAPFILFLRNRRPDQSLSTYRRRVRFTEGHELGHFFFHFDVRMVHRETDRTILEATRTGNFKLTEIENEANCFAAALLMPQEAFLADLEPSQIHGGEDWHELLVRKYDASHQAIRTRIDRLKRGCFLSGYAFAEDGVISAMMPSVDLELSNPSLASEAWRANPHVRNHVTSRIPMVLLREIWAQVRKLPDHDIAAAKFSMENLSISQILPTFSNGITGNAFVMGCFHNRRFIYFTIEIN